MNLCMLLDMASEAFGDTVAVAHREVQLTFGQLQRAAQALALQVRASGARHLVLLDVMTPAANIAVFAAAYAGVPYVPINFRLTNPEITALLQRVVPAFYVTSGDYRELIPADQNCHVADRNEVLSLADCQSLPLTPPDDDRAIAVQLFTSGTTGAPKAAILRHENLLSYILGTVEFASGMGDAILVCVPPYHIAGISSVLSSTYACRRMVLLDTFEPAAWLAACRLHEVSNAFVVPTMLGRIVDYLISTGEPARLPSLRALAYGGGKMPVPTLERAMRLLPQVDFTNAYGLTETSSTIAVLGPEEHRTAAQSSDPLVRARLGSVGKPSPAIELVIRSEDGVVLGSNQLGLIFVRGGQVSGEYLSLGSAVDGDGWFATRDRGYLDDGGYLFLDGRADDVIVRGAENISPGEIEEVLLAHPAVADVAVVAMPDEQWGEGIAAAVVLKTGQTVSVETLQVWVKNRLRSSRVPQKIVFKDSLPYNETGKILRRVIKQDFI